MKTHYDVLGVPRRADSETIRAALRKAAKAYHPDVNVGDPAAEQHLKRVIAAYEVLRNPKQRAAYDLGLGLRRRRNARRFFGTTLASTALISSVVLAMVVWLSKAKVASNPAYESSVSSAPEPETRETAIEINGSTSRKFAASNDEPPRAHEALRPALEPPSAAAEASGTENPKVAVLDRALPEDAELVLQRLRRLAAVAIPKDDPTLLFNDLEKAIPPKDAEFYLARGELRSKKADLDGAIADFDEAIRIDPRNALAFSHRAHAWGAKGDFHLAFADFEAAIRIDPANAAIFRDRGLLWRRHGIPDRALVDLDQAIRLGFSDAPAYDARGQIWLERGHYERAIADFNQAIKIDANFAGAYANRAIALRKKGDVDRASADLQHAIRLDPSVFLAQREVALSDKQGKH